MVRIKDRGMVRVGLVRIESKLEIKLGLEGKRNTNDLRGNGTVRVERQHNSTMPKPRKAASTCGRGMRMKEKPVAEG